MYEYDQRSNQVDHFYVLNHRVENNQVDNQSNDIDPKVHDENEQVSELYEHERVKLNHYVEVNFLSSERKNKKLLLIVQSFVLSTLAGDSIVKVT